MAGRPWTIEEGEGPLIAAAIHAGHEVRDEVHAHLALNDAERLREEDPFTDGWTTAAPTRVVVLRSRFEVDLGRPRERAVYRKPEDAWGMQVWRQSLPDGVVQRSLALHDSFYSKLGLLLDGKLKRHGRFVLFDLHSYNHRRGGPGSAPAAQEENPDIDLATFPAHRGFWVPVIDSFKRAFEETEACGRRLDLRANEKFFFGNLGDWVHSRYPRTGCVLSLDFKKIFMDEWTGELFPAAFEEIGGALAAAVRAVDAALAGMPA